ncbi:MAG: hypothetical protein WBH48_04630, partial [Pseudoalteromonas nigrifaciens]
WLDIVPTVLMTSMKIGKHLTKPASVASKLAGLVSLAPAGRRYAISIKRALEAHNYKKEKQ